MTTPIAYAPARALLAGAGSHPSLPGATPAAWPRRLPVIRADAGPEARAWLRGPLGRRALAPGRFASASEALAFVERLADAGAARAFIPEPRIRLRGFAEASDTLAFEVDPATDLRALIDVLNAEASCDWQLPLADARNGWIRWR